MFRSWANDAGEQHPMYTLLPYSNGGFVAILLTGKLEVSDSDGIVPIFEERIARHGKISLFREMRDFDGRTLGGFCADTKFDVKRANDFTRTSLRAWSRRRRRTGAA